MLCVFGHLKWRFVLSDYFGQTFGPVKRCLRRILLSIWSLYLSGFTGPLYMHMCVFISDNRLFRNRISNYQNAHTLSIYL